MPSVSPTPSGPLDACAVAAGARPVAVPVDAQTTMHVAVLGAGTRVVVMANQSDADLCAWLPFAGRLTAAGYQAVMWDYDGGRVDALGQVAAIVAAFRAGGAGRIALVGASQGAKVALVAGSRVTPPVDGVVSLSAEAVLRPNIEVAAAVTGLRCPALLVTAERDGYGAASAAPDILQAIPGTDKRLLTVPGQDHGTDLLSGSQAATVVPAVRAFLDRVTA